MQGKPPSWGECVARYNTRETNPTVQSMSCFTMSSDTQSELHTNIDITRWRKQGC